MKTSLEKVNYYIVKTRSNYPNKRTNTEACESFSDRSDITDLMRYAVEKTSNEPAWFKPYFLFPKRTEIMQAEITKLIDMGIIKVGESNYYLPMILIENPN